LCLTERVAFSKPNQIPDSLAAASRFQDHDSQDELEDLQALEVAGQAAFANFRHTFLE
jgi:hypothetical protein